MLDDVRYVEVEGGVHVESDLDACTLTGPHSHAWLSRLAPLLTGERTVDELTGGLPDAHRRMVERLVGVLAERRFVVDGRDGEPHTLSADELAVYAPEIAFIRYGFDSAEARFERLRRARVALVGDGPVMHALVEAGLGSGWREVFVVGDPDADVAVARGRRDAAQVVRVCSELPETVDVVLQVYGGERPSGLLELGRVCGEREVAFGQVWVGADEAWLTPVSTASAVSSWTRLDGLRRGADDWLTGAVPGVLAAQLVLSCFEYLTQMARPAERLTMTRVDLRSLDTRRHRVSEFTLRGGTASDAGEPLDAEELLKRAAGFVDARTGVLREVGEGDLVQVPLAVCRARVSDPLGVLGTDAAAPVIGWGRDRASARLRAVLGGLAAYQASLARPRPPTLVGVGAGLSREAAVTAGLVARCEELLRRVDRDDLPVVSAFDDPEVLRLVALLDAAGEAVRLRDLTPVLGVPAYASGAAAPACASTPERAMRRALEHRLLAWQARTNDQPCYADPVTLWHDGEDAEVFVRALTDAGHAPRVVLLDRDVEVARLLPHVVRVVCDE
ncbi:hypothetical protein [Actinomadura harenae]|uniref:Thiazole-containing bacteriocin maturation protein n=1 Tax=Actinomadura harenae TaxID=2483351 RepID=A0A3M2LYE0_9ACTN|nr:hypothetical protein [Actinomadura harenae]RMI42534.1 hypothetical protein EBO15_19015 [Actinomadura harenae]